MPVSGSAGVSYAAPNVSIIFCTPGTLDLCRVVLPDAGRLQEEDARQANKHGYTRHTPAEPLFTEADAYRAIAQLQPIGYDRPIQAAPGIQVDFIPAGHLLGSAYARVRVTGQRERTILFGGDLGRYGRPVLPDPSPVEEADVLLLESTYGNRVHPPSNEIGRQFRQPIIAMLRKAVFDRYVLPLDIADFFQTSTPRDPKVGVIARPPGGEEPDHRHCRLLRACRERPCDRRSTEQSDEVAPFQCSVPPVLPTERIAHLGAAGDRCAGGFRTG